MKIPTFILISIIISISCAPKYIASFNDTLHLQNVSKCKQKNLAHEENKLTNHIAQSLSLKDDFGLGTVLTSTDGSIFLSSKKTQTHTAITDKQLDLEHSAGELSVGKKINKTTNNEMLVDPNSKGNHKKKSLAVVGFLLIISGFILMIVPILGVMLLGIGAHLCFKALKKEKNVSNVTDSENEGAKNIEREKGPKGLALAGLIFLGILIILGIIGLIILFTQSP